MPVGSKLLSLMMLIRLRDLVDKFLREDRSFLGKGEDLLKQY